MSEESKAEKLAQALEESQMDGDELLPELSGEAKTKIEAAELLRKQDVDLVRYRKIVDRLPRTADDVPVMIMDEVWHPWDGRMRVYYGERPRSGGSEGYIAVGDHDECEGETRNEFCVHEIKHCYSTFEAAHQQWLMKTLNTTTADQGADAMIAEKQRREGSE